MADLTKGRRVTGAERDKLASDLKRKYESGATLRGRGGATRGKKK